MSKILYVPKRFSQESLVKIAQAVAIVEEYIAAGYELTLRQLYYQFVARGFIPNRQAEYRKLGSLVSDARRAGLIDWDAIVDRTRELRRDPYWSDPAEIVEECSRQFKLDRWADQANHVEVWIEKDALVGVFEQVCRTWGVGLFSCRGYASDSEIWRAAQRFRNVDVGKEVHVLHFGDHDPSGLDMTRDITDRLDLFGSDCHVHRLALNLDQIEQHNPPPNPAKVTDSRFAWYSGEYGGDSWELDALDPRTLTEIADREIGRYCDLYLYEDAKRREVLAREQLGKVARSWDRIVDQL